MIHTPDFDPLRMLEDLQQAVLEQERNQQLLQQQFDIMVNIQRNLNTRQDHVTELLRRVIDSSQNTHQSHDTK
jgi:hypothetical protein